MRRIVRKLLHLLGKKLKEIRMMERVGAARETMIGRKSIPNRIVRVSKLYVRPIVRGKEEKSVEFGAKCNNIQVDGISFIEKLSFNAFNEGTRLQHCVKMHKRLFGVEVKKIGGDKKLCGKGKPGLLQGGKHPDFLRETEPSIHDCEGKRLCEPLLIIHTANAVLLAERLMKQQRAKAA